MAPAFLSWLAQAVGSTAGVLDVVLLHVGTTSSQGMQLVPYTDKREHPRLARANKMRRDLQVYTDVGEHGLVILGRGLADRWEISLELDPDARGRGQGRAMISAARACLPADVPVFAQVSPGNARSLRAFLAAGFRPVGSEVLFP
jgi:GNAT superfamily N-acetyltransferase